MSLKKLATHPLKCVKSHAMNSYPFLEGVANFTLIFTNDFFTNFEKFGAYHAAFMHAEYWSTNAKESVSFKWQFFVSLSI